MGGVLGIFAHEILFTIRRLFSEVHVTHVASVQLWVLLTILLLVVRFLLDFFGPWHTSNFMRSVVLSIETQIYSMVHFTMGLMQLSGKRPNDYFQVWAVMLVTLLYSVKIGRPYDRSKHIPLNDIMSSLWAANLLRVQTSSVLKIPLWFIWALNAARIIAFFSSTDKAEAINQKNMRLVADYMNYEHTLGDVANPGKEFSMKWHKYLVYGEELAVEKAEEEATEYKIRLIPDQHDDLVTIDKIWSVDNGLLGRDGDPGNERKDVCLSFALYKMLRRRFYHLPIHEARPPRQEKLKRLVFEYIAESPERAFRVVALELSFLQDLFYSKHSAMFAGGFPAMNLLLSVSMIAATGYVAYPVRSIPGTMDQADGNSVTHGVFTTIVIVVFIICKELLEIYLYVFSQWTKVLILCTYARRRCARHPLVKMVMRAALCMMTRGSWDERIRQFNLLISSRGVVIFRLPTKSASIKLEECTKKAIHEAFKSLREDPERLTKGLYFSTAFGSIIQGQLRWADDLHAATHRILVWHIATSLCEINLCKADVLKPFWLYPRPLVKKSPGGDTSCSWWEHYTTAASLSNYCAYLVTQSLVPDNSVVTDKIFQEVLGEIDHVTFDCRILSLPWLSMRQVYDSLKKILDQGCDEQEPTVEKKNDRFDIKNSLTFMGAKLGMQLQKAYGEDRVGLWRDLSRFWTEFLLHLAAATRESKHRTCLGGNRELVTHLWALLSHAGFHGSASHGHQPLEREVPVHGPGAFDTT